MNTVPEGQSVGKLEPTPRTNYSIPRGENHIFGQLSARSVWLRSPKQKIWSSSAVIWACSKTFEPNYCLQKLIDHGKDCGYGVFSMRWMLLRFSFSFLTIRMYLSRLQSTLVFNNTNKFFCARKTRACECMCIPQFVLFDFCIQCVNVFNSYFVCV